jgi:hypothetical protein
MDRERWGRGSHRRRRFSGEGFQVVVDGDFSGGLRQGKSLHGMWEFTARSMEGSASSAACCREDGRRLEVRRAPVCFGRASNYSFL